MIQRAVSVLEEDRSLTRAKRREWSRRRVEAYSGAFLDVKIVGARQVDCHRRIARAPAKRPHVEPPANNEIWAYPFPSLPRSSDLSAFFVAGAKKTCAPFPAGQALQIHESWACCDGGDGFPCLYYGLGGTRLVRAPSPSPPSPPGASKAR